MKSVGLLMIVGGAVMVVISWYCLIISTDAGRTSWLMIFAAQQMTPFGYFTTLVGVLTVGFTSVQASIETASAHDRTAIDRRSNTANPVQDLLAQPARAETRGTYNDRIDPR